MMRVCSYALKGLGLKALMMDTGNNRKRAMRTTKQSETEKLSGELKRSETGKGAFPPPISCIGESGKPWVCFKSYRQDGRFVLKEIRIPTPEFLHAYREGGRLKLHFVQPNCEIIEEEEDDDVDEGNSFREEEGR